MPTKSVTVLRAVSVRWRRSDWDLRFQFHESGAYLLSALVLVGSRLSPLATNACNRDVSPVPALRTITLHGKNHCMPSHITLDALVLLRQHLYGQESFRPQSLVRKY